MLPLPEVNFKRTPVTLIVAAVAVALEVVSTLDPDRRYYYLMDMKLGVLSTIWEGELWRPFTSTLLHANLIHLLFNVYCLLTFGWLLEPRFGSFRFLGLFALLAYVSMLPDFVITNYRTPIDAQISSVGLSGIAYGLFGMLWVGRRWHPEFEAACNADTVRLFILLFFFCIALTALDVIHIANIAHGAGLVFGVLYGLAIFDVRRRLRWAVLAGLATALVLSTLIAVPGHNGYEHARQKQQYERLIHDLRQLAPAEQQEER